MGKRYFTTLLALAMVLGTLGGCARTQNGPEDEAPAEAAGPSALTAEEIEQVNQAFVPNFEKDGWVDVNPLCCLVSCFYAEPEDIDLSAFLAYTFPVERGPEWEPVGEEEFQALREQADWLGESLEAWRTPIGRIPRDQVDAFLEKYTGITTADLTAPWTAYGLVYLEEYDAYYNFTSDFNPGGFTCEEGVRDGGTVRLTGHGQELTLEEQPDGSWHFVSFLWLEKEAEGLPQTGEPGTLTAREIDRVNQAFAASYTVGHGSYATQISCFFTSYYEKPEDINFREFMYLFSPGEILPDDSEELQALSQLEDWPFGEDVEPSFLPCPTHKYKRADVDAALEKYLGITTADLTHVQDSGPVLLYLPEYDAYYNFTSDFGPGTFTCVSGRRDGGTVRLTGDRAELVLEKQTDGTYHIVSHLPLEAEE